jgi:hypothetical protein
LLEAEEDMKELVCDCGEGDGQYRQYFMVTVAVFTDATRRERQVIFIFLLLPPPSIGLEDKFAGGTIFGPGAAIVSNSSPLIPPQYPKKLRDI